MGRLKCTLPLIPVFGIVIPGKYPLNGKQANPLLILLPLLLLSVVDTDTNGGPIKLALAGYGGNVVNTNCPLFCKM